MKRVLLGALLLVTIACGQGSSDQTKRAALSAQANTLERQKADLTVVDEAEYQGLFVTEDPITFAVRVNYIRFSSGRVSEIMFIQIPANIPTDQPFITGRWRNGVLVESQVCELRIQGQAPTCEAMRAASRHPEIQAGGEDLLRHTYQSVATGLREQFDRRGNAVPEAPPNRVTTS